MFLKRVVSLKVVSNTLFIQQFAQLEVLVVIQVVESRLKVKHDLSHSVEVFFTGSRVVSCGHWLNVALVKFHERLAGHHLKEVLSSETAHNLLDEEVNQIVGSCSVEHDSQTLEQFRIWCNKATPYGNALHFTRRGPFKGASTGQHN